MLPNLSEKTRKDIKTLADICAVAVGIFIVLYMLGIINRKP
jgi:hypothetical protein